jgi:hypothetical protein
MRGIGIFLIFLGTFFSGCTLFVDEDLRNDVVNMYTPANDDTIVANPMLFWWKLDKGATHYNLQIVRPSFASIQQLIVDSNVFGDKFYVQLNPGQYEMRIRAENNSTQSDYFYRNFYVSQSDSLSNQSMVLISPADNFYTNASDYTFAWYPIISATYYTFELRQNGGTIYSTNVSYDDISVNSLLEGNYEWRVRANNDNSSTAFASRNFGVDFSPPGIPTLILPANNDTVSPDFTFSWQRATDTGAPLSDTLYICSDTSGTIVLDQFYCIFPSYNITEVVPGIYYWRVKSTDKAGNTGFVSNMRRFIVE